MYESQANGIIIPNVDRLDELDVGSYTLRAPVDATAGQEVIMMGVEVTAETPKGQLDVVVSQHIGRSLIEVSRAPGEGLLQAKSLDEGVPVSETPFVFGKAVGNIAVEKAVGLPGVVRSKGIEVTDVPGLSHFLRIIAQFSKLAHTPSTVVIP